MLQDTFESWKKQHSDIVKLQWCYVSLTVVLVTVAGLVALLNQSVSRQLLTYAGTVFTVFLVNLVASAVIGPLMQPKRSTNKQRNVK